MKDTIQRLQDLHDVIENKEIRLLCKILIDYLKKTEGGGIGFKNEKKD